MAHVAALRALGDDLGVGVVVFVEGRRRSARRPSGLLGEYRERCPPT
jgi:hypothetical protein